MGAGKKRVLIGCEFSGIVREEFRRRGHDAWSIDLLDTEIPGQHVKANLLYVPYGFIQSFDLFIVHPDCRYLTYAGVRWLYKDGRGTVRDMARWSKMQEAANFFNWCMGVDIPLIAAENPIMHRYAREIVGRKYDQIIQPWQFGHKEMKGTCFWLKGLTPLAPTAIVGPPPAEISERRKWARVHRAQPGPDRWKERSRTLKGIAEAMADQWGDL